MAPPLQAPCPSTRRFSPWFAGDSPRQVTDLALRLACRRAITSCCARPVRTGQRPDPGQWPNCSDAQTCSSREGWDPQNVPRDPRERTNQETRGAETPGVLQKPVASLGVATCIKCNGHKKDHNKIRGSNGHPRPPRAAAATRKAERGRRHWHGELRRCVAAKGGQEEKDAQRETEGRKSSYRYH